MVSVARPTVLVVAALLTGAACADDESAAVAGSSTVVPSTLAPTSLPAPSATEPVSVPASVGAPGIDDPDAFCASWARVVGIPQILTIAANFGGLDTFGLARLEVFAAPVVSSALSTLEETYPVELEDEREIWFTRVLGPVAARAARAVTMLVGAGATTEDFARLEEVWIEALRTRDPSSPVPTVPTPGPALEAIVDRATAAFDAEVTPWIEDPALAVDDSLAPAITAYTRTSCPDLSDLGIGDDL